MPSSLFSLACCSVIRFMAGCFLLLGGGAYALAAGAEVAFADGEERPPAMRLMTFNIRYNTARDGDNAWPHRRDEVADIISDQEVDIVGMQEVLKGQMEDLIERLPDYDWYGVGRADGVEAGEYAPFFYRRERFERLDQGEFWLCETPDEPGVSGWDAACPRITTWLKLRDRQTEQIVLIANTHFDHRGSEARLQSARLIQNFCAEQADIPCIVMGDFNCGVDSEALQVFTHPEGDETPLQPLHDAHSLSQSVPRGPDSTWNGFNAIVPGRRIDFILVSPRFDVLLHHILDNTDAQGHFPSDHLPVMADVTIRPAE